jgi:predicted  nucleic acid-binding Zn-ribbon protein
MTDEQANAMSEVESAQEVDRIRDIIFGPQMRDYQHQFQTLRQDLERLQQQVSRFREQLMEEDRELGDKLQALQREMQEADDDLRGDLRQAAQELTTSKVDRETLGTLFAEIGTCLKGGGSVADLLQNLVGGDQSPDNEQT